MPAPKSGKRRPVADTSRMGRPKTPIVEGCKKCSRCTQMIPLADFWKSVDGGHGLQAYCKFCATSERCLNARHRASSDKRRTLMHSARARAKKKGLPFDLTIEDIIVPDLCPVLGIPIFIVQSTSGGRDNSPSIDRRDNKLGYVKTNIDVISWRANRIKSDATPAELRLVADYYEVSYAS